MLDKYKDIKTGVIGVGSMGQNHARIYNEISNFVAVSDLDQVQGKKISERFGTNFYEDYKEMFSEVDAISIAVPTSLHLDVYFAVTPLDVLCFVFFIKEMFEAPLPAVNQLGF